MRNCLVLILLLVGVSGCVTEPTKVVETQPRQMQAAEKMLAPIELTKETIVVDARPRFDYSTAHIPRSVSLQWSDFTEPESGQRGIIQNDIFAAARRLARAGIGPDTHVVVIGRGPQGDGEEGRMAWMLAYLGVKRVQFAAMDSFKVRVTNLEEQNPPPSVPIWIPEPIESLNVTRDEVLFAINKKATAEPQAYRKGQPPVVYRLIDVRSERDYMGRAGFGADKPVPNMEAINIPWTHFFTKDLRPRVEVREELKKLGIQPGQRVVVLNQNGVASAAVTMALRALGYGLAGNYAGGLQDLVR